MVASLICKVMGAVFVLVAIWGFIAGDHVLIFHVNTAHNAVHLLSGIGALACGFAGERAAKMFSFAFGAVYGLVAVLGLLGIEPVVEMLHLNGPDNWLHIAIAVVFISAGLASTARGRIVGPSPG